MIATLPIMLAAFLIFAGMIVPAQAQTIAFPAPTTFIADYCSPYPYPCGNSTVAATTGDFNGDGKLDVLTLDNSSDLNVILGNGDGTFQTPISLNIAASGFFPEAIAVGDFTSSHLLDVAVWAMNATTGNSEVHIYLGNGTGSLTYKATYAVPNSSTFNPSPNSLVAADVNGDGKLDLVALTPYNGVFIFLGNGDGTFQAPVAYTIGCTGSCNGLAVGDLNGDGKPDLAIANFTGMSILLNAGSGTFGAATYYASGIGGVIAGGGIAIGDVNGDKKPDVVVTASNIGVIVYLNQGGGVFTVKGTVGSIPIGPTNNVVLADINNDKKLDIVIPDGAGDVFTFYGKGNGTFTAGPSYPLQAQSGNYLVAVGDFNGDGALDLLDTDGLSYNTVSLGRGDGTFRTAQLYAYTAANEAANIVTADFNGDGIPDIAQSVNGIVNGTSINGKIGINLGSSHGALGATSYVTASTCIGNTVYWVATGDVNGDGKADLVATMRDDSSAGCQNQAVAVLEGLGTGKFKKAAYYPTGATVQEEAVYLVDVNGDGKLDIVTANNDSSISVLLNQGNGTYKTEPLITSLAAIEGYGVYLAFGDFNGDGKMDIAATLVNAGNGTVYVLPGNGNGTFGAPISTATPYIAVGLAAADFKNNGKTDLVVTSGQGCGANTSIYFYLASNGNGTFTPGATGCLSHGIAGVPVVADFNGDGKLDVAVPFNGYGLGSLAVLQGKGDGTFTNTQTYYTGDNYSSLAVADFNGDGMLDIARLNQGSFVPSFVSIMLNATQPVSISPLNVKYGSVTVDAKKAETVILTNNQKTLLAISSITLGGTDPGDFSAKSTCGTSRKAGWDCTITVTFTPTVTGARTATLNIKDAVGTQTVQLSGTGK